MCFCFDGEGVVAAWPDDCRERLPDASAPVSRPNAYVGEHAAGALPVRSNPAASTIKRVALKA